jgi:hypothetical protein
LRAARYLAGAGAGDAAKLKKVHDYVDAAAAWLPEVFADQDLPAYELYEFMRAVVDAQSRSGDAAGTLGTKVLAALDKGALPRSAALTGKGDYYLLYGWDARGNGFANTVTPAGGAAFEKRVQLARDAFLEAWKLDPANAEAACGMIVVEKAIGSSRKDLEQWYRRALTADPDSYRAAMRKLEYLYPQWNGSPKEMIAHGRQVAAGGRWEGGLPLVLVEAHWDRAQQHDPSKRPVDPAYFDGNDEAWKDVKRVYEAYLKQVPDSRYHRTRYALIAAWCGQWADARREFDKLGEDFSRRVAPEAWYREAQDRAAGNGRKTP